MDRGTLIDHDGRPALRFRRSYPHLPEHVWIMITDPSELAHWFPGAVTLEPRVGGAMTFADPNLPSTTGRVLAFDRPHRFAFTWADDEVHLELEPEGDGGCRLTLIDVLDVRDAAARNAAGWSVCLDDLDKLVAGQTAAAQPSSSDASWQDHYDAYVELGWPRGAPIPGRTEPAG